LQVVVVVDVHILAIVVQVLVEQVECLYLTLYTSNQTFRIL
jgi:hypothetical protein